MASRGSQRSLLLAVTTLLLLHCVVAAPTARLRPPSWVAKGFEGSPVARLRKVPTVTVGYGTAFTVPVPVGSKNALPFFTQALKLLRKWGGGRLLIGPGAFTLAGQMQLDANNTRIQGAGIRRTVLRLANNATAWKNSGFVRGAWVQNISMSDLTLDGNKKYQNNTEKAGYGRYGVYTQPCVNCKFERMAVNNWQRYGFDPHGIKNTSAPKSPQYNFWGYGLTIINCEANNNDWDGFTLDMTYDVYVANNTAINNGRYGYNICTASRNVLLEYNYAKGNGFGPIEPEYLANKGNGCGFVVDTNKVGFDVYNVTIRHNTAINSFRAGYCVKDSGNQVVISNNIVEGGQFCAHWNEAWAVFSYNQCSKVAKGRFGTPAKLKPSNITYIENKFIGV